MRVSSTSSAPSSPPDGASSRSRTSTTGTSRRGSSCARSWTAGGRMPGRWTRCTGRATWSRRRAPTRSTARRRVRRTRSCSGPPGEAARRRSRHDRRRRPEAAHRARGRSRSPDGGRPGRRARLPVGEADDLHHRSPGRHQGLPLAQAAVGRLVLLLWHGAGRALRPPRGLADLRPHGGLLHGRAQARRARHPAGRGARLPRARLGSGGALLSHHRALRSRPARRGAHRLRRPSHRLRLADEEPIGRAGRRGDLMRLFVTGAAGFTGTNYVRYVLANHPDDRITAYDKLTYAGNPDNLRGLEDERRFTFVKGDICDAETLEALLPGHDAVVNFAAESHVDRSILNAGEFVRTNVLGTNTLLDVARRLEVPTFLHVSTDETYGSIASGSFRESDVLTPSSPYSASKAGADLLAHAYWGTVRYPEMITRSSNNFGSYQFPEKMIPLFITNLLEDRPVPVYGDGLNVRDWIYVEDNCTALDLVLRKGAPGAVYNIGAGNELANLELTRRVLRLLGKPESLISYVTDRPGHDRRCCVDTTTMSALG